MLLSHILQEIAQLKGINSRWANTNVDSIEVRGQDVVFLTDSCEIKELRGEIDDRDSDIKRLEEDGKELDQKNSDLEEEILKLTELTEQYRADSGETMQELLDANKEQGEQLKRYQDGVKTYRDLYEVGKKEVEKLRARLNKAVVERSGANTLVCEFKEKRYTMVEIVNNPHKNN